MTNQCMNCGGPVHFDIESGQLRCMHCDSRFDPETYTNDAAAEEQQASAQEVGEAYDVTLYTCPNCGAQISSLEQAAVDYCLYCGSFVALKRKMSQLRKPDYIMPFTKTEEDCKSAYKKLLSKKLYAPREFRDEEFLSGFKPIFIPYWCYNYTYGPSFTLLGEDETRHGDYMHVQHYKIQCHGKGSIDGITFDASSTFDDALSDKVAPFDRRKMRAFKPSYMFGFFGDTADVAEDIYHEDASKIARDAFWKEIEALPSTKEGHFKALSDDAKDRAIHMERSTSLAMLPIWFLTWRKNDRIAYSIMNGDSGEIYSELPVDTLRYLLISFLTAIPIFLLLNLQFTFSVYNMLTMALILSILTTIFATVQQDKIVRRTFHADDSGYLYRFKNKAKQNEELFQNSFMDDLFELIVVCVSDTFPYNILILIGCFLFFFGMTSVILIMVLLFMPIFTIYRIRRNTKIIKNNSIWIDLSGSIFATVISIVLLVMDPAADMFYFGTALICMAGIGFTAIRTMMRYNELVTRPVPQFFDRTKGGSK